MYTMINFQTKKELKEAVKSGRKVEVFQPGLWGGGGPIKQGRVSIEGPHYPQPHRWYARVLVENGVVTKIIS
ncbi:MAG: hypothetical protein ACNA7J_14060 [Wenzhouxiangella sp.]